MKRIVSGVLAHKRIPGPLEALRTAIWPGLEALTELGGGDLDRNFAFQARVPGLDTPHPFPRSDWGEDFRRA
jgi:hypothetical protein